MKKEFIKETKSISNHEIFVRNKRNGDEMVCNINPRIWQWTILLQMNRRPVATEMQSYRS